MPSETACRVSDGIPRSVLFFPVKHHRLHRRARQAFGQCQHRHQPHGKRIFQHRLPTQPAQGGTAKQQLENPRDRSSRASRHARQKQRVTRMPPHHLFVRQLRQACRHDQVQKRKHTEHKPNSTVPTATPADTDTSSPARPNASAKASCTANANGNVKNTSPANRAA